jgi:hypothetical protein
MLSSALRASADPKKAAKLAGAGQPVAVPAPEAQPKADEAQPKTDTEPGKGTRK